MVSPEDVAKLTALARIKISDQELAGLTADVEAILEYVSQIKQAPMQKGPADARGPRTVMRDDGEPHEAGAFTERMLAAAPKRSGEYVSVKKILNR